MPSRILSARRALICLGAGIAAGIIAAITVAPDLGPLVGWCVAGTIALTWVWRICWHQDPAGTRELAQEESGTRITDNAIIAACLASIAAVAVALIQSKSADLTSVALVILGVLGTMIAWALVNTVYALKYARLHFIDQAESGFDVKQDRQPTYSDFAYYAFTIGMSYAAPEIEPVTSKTRRKALPHALLSYFFGTVLIAVAINLVTNLSQQ